MSFNFGSTAPAAAAAPKPGGFSFGTPAAAAAPAAAPAGGFSFGAGATAAPAATTAAAPGGFSFGAAATPAASTAAPATGFSLGQPAAAPATGFTLGTSTAGTTGLLGANTGLLGAAQPTAAVAPNVAGTTPATGFGFGATAKTTAPSALTGLLTSTTSTAAIKPTLTLGSTAATSTTGLGGGLAGGLGGGLGTGLTTGVTSTAGGLGGGLAAGGLGGGGLAKTTTAAGLGGFGLTTGLTAATTQVNTGLGGVDPKTSTSASGVASNSYKPGDTKAVKETAMPKEVTATVNEFTKFVKSQKEIREQSARMTSKPLFKVKEEMTSLKQMVSALASGLHRNSVAIEALKVDTGKELKHAEISQRTKDTPPGLQYENTAPTEYFQLLMFDFERRMVLYRQQIEEMESYLASMQQTSILTPHELTDLLHKIHESFIIVASQLHTVHEAVKVQKEQYLNYRKVFHGDTTDVFEKRRKLEEMSRSKSVGDKVGPTPFTGMSNAAALAMVAALNRGQQPAAGGAPTLGLNSGLGVPGLGAGTLGATGLGTTGLGTTGFGSTGLGTTGLGTGLFGAATTQPAATGFGGFGAGSAAATTSSGFGFGSTFSSPATAAVRPLGQAGPSFSTSAGNLFGSNTQQQTQGFSSGGSLGFSSAGGVAGQENAFGAQNTGFQLQKPPAGNKRGKKV